MEYSKAEKERLLKWADLLDSGRFKQTTGVLCEVKEVSPDVYKEAFCCLGVLCALHNAETSPKKSNWSGTRYLGQASWLPGSVEDWIGLRAGSRYFAKLNDTYQLTFKQIAVVIRRMVKEGSYYPIKMTMAQDPNQFRSSQRTGKEVK